MVRTHRRWNLLGSTALLALAVYSSFGLSSDKAVAACTTNLVAFPPPGQSPPSGISYITTTSTGVIVPDGTVIHSNHTSPLNGGDGIHIVPAPGGAGPFAANNGNGCIETQGTVSITVVGLNDDRDGIRVISAEPGLNPALAGNAEVYASAGTTIVTSNLLGDGIIARSSILGDLGANGAGAGNTIVHSDARIITNGGASAGITTRNAGLLSEVISGGNITTTSEDVVNLGPGIPQGTYSAGISVVNQYGGLIGPTAVARLIVNNNSTVETKGSLSPAAFVGAFGTAAIEANTSLGNLITTGDDSPGLVLNSVVGNVTATAGTVSATGQFSPGIVALSSSIGAVNLTIDADAVVTGGWQANASGTSANTGAASAGVIIGGGLVAASTLTNNGAIGALSDRAIASGDRFIRVVNPVQPFPAGQFSAFGGSLSIDNNSLVTGFVELGAGQHSFTNDGFFDTRHFAATSDDGIRDTERVARSDFGGNALTSFTNSNTLRLLTVSGAETVDTTGQYVPVGLSGGYPAAAYNIGLAGVEQAHLLNLPSFVNAGLITMQDGETGGSGSVAGDVLVISGRATPGSDGGGVFRTGGELHLDTLLNEGSPANSISDVLVVDSTDSSGGSTLLRIANAGGAGGATDINKNGVVDEGEGILVVEVLNAGASADDAFALGGPVRAGAWTYDLFWGETGGDWYLVNFLTPTVWHPVLPSPLGFARGAPVPQCDAGAAPNADLKDPYDERSGCGCATGDTENGRCHDNELWTRAEGGYAKRDSDGDEDGYKLEHFLIQAGYERMGWRGDGYQFAFGPFAHVQTGELTSIDALRHVDGAKIDFTGYGGGLAGRFDSDSGFYFDTMGHVTAYDLDVEDADGASEGAEGDTDGWAHGVNAETGLGFRTSQRFQLTPHLGLNWNAVDIDDYRGTDGIDREFDTVESLIGYAGLRADYVCPIAESYFDAWLLSGTVRVDHEFDGDSTVTSVDPVSGAATESTLDGEDTRLGFTGRVSIAQWDTGSSHSLGLAGGYSTSLERDSEAYNGSLEFKVAW